VTDSDHQVGTRSLTGVIWRVIGRLAFAAMITAFTVFMIAGYVVAYQDLSGGPYCDFHRMGPDDTCSVLNWYGVRGWNSSEKLNPPGSHPAVLPVPGRNSIPERTSRSVRSQAEMRNYHRKKGYWLLGGSTMFALILVSIGRRLVGPGKTVARVVDEQDPH
jgi:hypothetical protein